MNAIIRTVIALLFACPMGILAGCGGGSSPSTTVAGTASKGLFTSGSVSIYSIDSNGTRSTTPLSTGTIDANGQFNVNIGTYAGAVVIEATGVYTDEATGTPVTVAAGRPMRAVLASVDSSSIRRIGVTPLTDLAYSLAAPVLTPQAITAASARVSDIFKIADITAVEPVKADATTLATASTDQQAYTLALATLSQMAQTANPGGPDFTQIVALLDAFRNDLSASATAGLGAVNQTAFSAALTLVTSTQLPGVTGSLSSLNTAAATLSSVGSTSLKLTFSVAAPPAGVLIGGLQGTVTLPTGTTARVKSATDREILAGLLTATSGSLLTGAFVPQTLTLGLINGNGFAGGDFAGLTVDVASGAPSAANVLVGTFRVLDINGNTLNLAVTVR